MTRPKEQLDAVEALITEGRNDCEIARLTGVPRETVRDWRRGVRGSGERPSASGECRHDFRSLPPRTYSYVLGMYLGDGCISRQRRHWRLRIVMDARYPGIIDECCRGMEELLPGKCTYRLHRKDSACVEVSMGWKHWPCLFTQHGPGKKHDRRILLEAWQENLLSSSHESFLRGLVHSDGCRVVANDRGVKSVRYHFSNRSEDIKNLFCASLSHLDIHWTRPSDRQIAVYRKADVAKLDRFIGPKF